MVFLTTVARSVIYTKTKGKFGLPRKSSFIDKLRLYVRGGNGGQGFKRYGGIGGKGGDVYLEADSKVTLENVKKANPIKRFIGTVGGDSRRHGLLGEPGADVIIPVPVGVSALTDDGQNLGDLNEEGGRVLVALGGDGGRPQTQYMGDRGQRLSVSLDLKLIADVGLVGFPNAGKSTFLGAISRAQPKIANYPFTTLKPQIGVIQYDDLRQISVADLPGLIEGAHINVGMGHHFLKHVERTKLLLFIVDIFGFQLSVKYKHRSALETILLLNKELHLYKDSLVTSKPALLVLNKTDLPDSGTQVEQIMRGLDDIKQGRNPGLSPDVIPDDVMTFDDVISISAQTGDNVNQVGERIRQILDFYDEKRHREESEDCEDFIKNGLYSVRERHGSRFV